MDSRPHLALPLRIVGSGYVAVQQDTLDELTTTVAVVCAFPLGSRSERPEFGIAPPELQDEPLALAGIEAAITTWEPRAAVAVSERAGADDLASTIQVQVAMARSTEEELS
jgi:phage baseplate assembly protein W